MAQQIDIRLNPGERGLIVGQTGSGKTYGAAWMLRYSTQRVVVFDTKHEPLFEQLPRDDESLEIVSTVPEMLTAWRDTRRGPDYLIVRPPPALMADPFEIDAYLYALYDNAKNALVYVDEAYQLHRNAQAGPGLIALLTRGRARALTTLISTQRPAWLSRFALTESQKFYLFRLIDRADWARLSEIIPNIPREGIKLEPYHFLYYKQGEDDYTEMAPLKPIANLSYTPQADEPDDGKPRRKWF
jgi:DNA helicase HerA-like ATPase